MKNISLGTAQSCMDTSVQCVRWLSIESTLSMLYNDIKVMNLKLLCKCATIVGKRSSSHWILATVSVTIDGKMLMLYIFYCVKLLLSLIFVDVDMWRFSVDLIVCCKKYTMLTYIFFIDLTDLHWDSDLFIEHHSFAHAIKNVIMITRILLSNSQLCDTIYTCISLATLLWMHTASMSEIKMGYKYWTSQKPACICTDRDEERSQLYNHLQNWFLELGS